MGIDRTELNEAVAKKLMPHEIIIVSRVKDYCHSIEAAWEIIGKRDDMVLELDHDLGWRCRVTRFSSGPVASQTWVTGEGIADTAPMAICQAFLKLEEK